MEMEKIDKQNKRVKREYSLEDPLHEAGWPVLFTLSNWMLGIKDALVFIDLFKAREKVSFFRLDKFCPEYELVANENSNVNKYHQIIV